MQAVKSIQAVLEHHALSGVGTYDPMDIGDPGAAFEVYNETRDKVLNDPAYIKAKDYLTGLKVELDNDETYIVVGVDLPVGEYGEAGTDVYLDLGDPNELMRKGKRKGQPRIVNSIMIQSDYTNADQVTDVTR